jgi:transcriptional regulator with XRE-family HTH domain
MPRRTEATPFTIKFGARMRGLRTELGISLSRLSDATHVSKGHLSSIEQGLAAITVETVDRIAIGLGLSPALLLAFPKEDELARVMDLVRLLPKREITRLRRELKERVKEFEMED